MDGFVAIADEANAGCTQLVLRDLRETFGEDLVRAICLCLVYGWMDRWIDGWVGGWVGG